MYWLQVATYRWLFIVEWFKNVFFLLFSFLSRFALVLAECHGTTIKLQTTADFKVVNGLWFLLKGFKRTCCKKFRYLRYKLNYPTYSSKSLHWSGTNVIYQLVCILKFASIKFFWKVISLKEKIICFTKFTLHAILTQKFNLSQSLMLS